MSETKKFRAEDALPLMSEKADIAWAKLNEVAGPGFTWMVDGKVMACGGIRTFGVGEAWAVFTPDAKTRKKELLRLSKDTFKAMIESSNLWQVFATTRDISEEQANYLEHLGFEKSECYIYVRK